MEAYVSAYWDIREAKTDAERDAVIDSYVNRWPFFVELHGRTWSRTRKVETRYYETPDDAYANDVVMYRSDDGDEIWCWDDGTEYTD